MCALYKHRAKVSKKTAPARRFSVSQARVLRKNRNAYHDGAIHRVFRDSEESLLMQTEFWEDFLRDLQVTICSMMSRGGGGWMKPKR